MATAPKIRLDDCCEIVAGATPSTSDESCWGGDIHWATPKDLSELDTAFISGTPRRLTRKGLESCAAKILPVGSVLFSSRAPIGHVAVNTVPMATNQGFKSFIPDSSQVFAKYLYWWLKSNRAYLESLGNGATFKEVSKSIVSKIEIPLPPISEQKRIAELLDKAEELRAKRRAALAQLDTLTQSIFLEMFGDLVSNPRHQHIVMLGDVADILTGYPFRSQEYVAHGASIRLCRGTNVLPGRVDWSDLASWPKSKLLNLDEFYLAAGDILIAMDRPWISEGFKIASVKPVDCPSLLVQRVARLRGQKGVSNEFLYHLLKQPAFTRHCRPTETTIPHISPKDIKSFAFPLPPIEIQRGFTNRVTAVEKLKSVQLASLAELDTLFASLQHRAFNGSDLS